MKNLALTMILSLGMMIASGCQPPQKQSDETTEVPPVSSSQRTTTKSAKELSTLSKDMFGLLPEKMPGGEKDTEDMVKLGEKLYFDKILSLNDSLSCNSCHMIDNKKAGVDGLPLSPGANKENTGRNSPTVLNAGYQFVQFWDGRAKNLVEQSKEHICSPVEMGMTDGKEVVKKLKAVKEYEELFKKAFPKDPEPLTYDNVALAIAAFERTLISKSPFDDFMAGKTDALKPEELKGYEDFMNIGCITCHSGALLGGNNQQKSGFLNPYDDKKDLGLYEITKQETDKYMFKVPMLRNVVLTAPYFHDGKVQTIEEAVKKIAHMQLGKELNDAEVASLVSFLNALSDPERTK